MDKKVGIMGGTFNPIHLGHLIIAETAREAFHLDEILFIPTGQPYMKDSSDVLDRKTRVVMTGIAIEDNPFFVLSTIEADKEGNSYSCETITDLKKENPDVDYYFIIGADTLFNMETWKKPEQIFKETTVLVSCRKGQNTNELKNQMKYLANKYECVIKMLPLRNVDISSSDIRNRIKMNQSVRYMLHDNVHAYIKQNKLYTKNPIKTGDNDD